MKFLSVCLLAVLAVGSVRANADECTEERAEACIDGLLAAILDDSTEEEVCRELRTSIDCLRSAVDECLDERDDEVEEGLQELEKVLKDNCGSGDSDGVELSQGEDEEIAKCFEENEEHIFECVEVGAQEALTSLLQNGNADENVMKCTMYGLMAQCFVERTRDKCGEKAAAMADEELSDIPEEIKEACQEAAGLETYAFNLLEDMKKK